MKNDSGKLDNQLRDVFLHMETNKVSFTQETGSIIIGETNGTLKDFIEWMRQDWKERGISLDGMPSI
jgi:hypothetical protein